MTLRVAIGHYNQEMSNKDALGADEIGRSIAKGYFENSKTILQKIFK